MLPKRDGRCLLSSELSAKLSKRKRSIRRCEICRLSPLRTRWGSSFRSMIVTSWLVSIPAYLYKGPERIVTRARPSPGIGAYQREVVPLHAHLRGQPRCNGRIVLFPDADAPLVSMRDGRAWAESCRNPSLLRGIVDLWLEELADELGAVVVAGEVRGERGKKCVFSQDPAVLQSNG